MKKANEQFCVTIQDLESVKAKMKEFCNSKETIHVSFESKKIVILKENIQKKREEKWTA